MRITAACDIDVLVGRVARVVGHQVDGVATQIEMVDTGTRFVLEPHQLELIGDEPGLPACVPSGDAQPARTGVRP